MKKIIRAILVLLLAFISPDGFAQEPSAKGVLTIGKATDEVTKTQKWLQPIISYLASRLGDAGVERGEVVLAADNSSETILKYLRERKIDMVIDTPFQIHALVEQENAAPLLSAWRKGSKEYQAYIFSRKDGGITKLEDLKGKVIAFEDPGSTSSYFLPKYTLKAMGLDLVELESSDSSVPEGNIGYVFAGSEINISAWVFHGKVAAGALNDQDWEIQEHVPAAYREAFNIVGMTKKVPRMLLAVRGDLDRELVRRIKEELMNMHTREEGKKALSTRKLNKFEELPGGPEGVFEPIRDLLRIAKEEAEG